MAEGRVDGVVTQSDVYGTIQGNGGAVDKMAGAAGNDTLLGHAAFNQYYGGEGSDTFIVSAAFALEGKDGASKAYGDQFAFITDFQGAGGYSATNNDFVAFTGFGANAVLTEVGTGASGTSSVAKLYYYTISWTDSSNISHVTNIALNSVNGEKLSSNDYAFY